MKDGGLVLMALGATIAVGGLIRLRRPLISNLGITVLSAATNDLRLTRTKFAASEARAGGSYPGVSATGCEMPEPRGLRNNNPGNIRRDDTQWIGTAPDQSSDPDFVVFTEALWGLRAIARIMLNKQARGPCTVRQLLSGCSGWSARNLAAYAAFIADQMGVSVDDSVDLARNPQALTALVSSIVQIENRQQPYSADYVAAAVSIAGTLRSL